MSWFTDEEISALSQFRRRVDDVLPRDEYSQRDENLIRWLRARNLNLDRAEQMLRESIKWREINEIDKLQEDSELSEKFQVHLDGLDKTGRPVVTLAFGTWDIKGFIESEPESMDRFVKYCTKMLENMLGTIRRLTLDRTENEGELLQIVLIADLSGYSFAQLMNLKALQATLKLISTLEAYYPEMLAVALIINAPAVFYMLFALVKPILSGGTLGKLQILNSEKSSWLPALLEMIEPSQIRERYGGTKL